MVKATTIVAGIALVLAGAPALAQKQSNSDDSFTPARAEGYAAVTDWPDFTGVWSPDWAYLFASRGARRGSSPVLTPEAQAKYDAFLEKQKREGVNQYLQANCIPPGMPGIMRQPYPVEFLFSPGRVTLLTETYSQARRLYLDGRALPDDPEPLFNGTSVGRWEGDTLVVDTVGFNHLVTYQSGIEPSQNMRIHEHFWLAEPDVMMVETTITDPGVLAEPLVQLQAYRRQPDWDMREYVCEENNRLTDEEGGANIDLGFDELDEDPFGPPPED
ncbi:MAG: hypothetical protein B7Y88_07740 [Sphingomonadales bacterium 32-64-17]|nr:MAG: hypothetical protein B7Y88_07740 [Sphingomonadales bacterium 32-64-17]